MEFKDYYKILGVETSADTKAIKIAYRRLARTYHPDVSDHHDAEDKFKEVTEAYNVLKDPEKRANYDELREHGQHGQQFKPPPQWQSSGKFTADDFDGSFSDFFESLFEVNSESVPKSGPQTQNHHMRGADIELEMPVFLEETISETAKTISYSLPRFDLNGNPLENLEKTLKVSIPKGISDGEVVRLKQQGSPGVNGAPSGDLFIRIRLVPHPLFDLEGHHLVLTLPITPWEAVLGANIVVPTLTGTIRLTLPENSQSGRRLRVKGKGLFGKLAKGDLYVVLNVVVPEITDVDEENRWKEMAEKSSFDPRMNLRTKYEN